MKRFALFLIMFAALCGPVMAQGQQGAEQVLQDAFTYRNLGPFRAGTWVSAVAVPDGPAKSHLYTIYAAPRNGGVWKSVNNGVTFTPTFDKQTTLSMGAIAVAPSNEAIVWAGTGDASCTRSATPGDGIYRSADGAATWQNMGLRDSQHIARIAIHPTNPDVVYVAAMGHLYSTNEERGVFKTTDGGKTWKNALYVNERTGVIDLVLDRKEPDTLYAATYECTRDPWRINDGGAGSGIYKTIDGGATWKKLEGGLPTGAIGRIGLDIYQKDPSILYAIIDNRNAGGGRGGGGGGLIGGEVYRTDNGGGTWQKVSAAGEDLSRKAGYSFNQLRISTGNPNQVFVTGSSMAVSADGGRTWAGLGGAGGAGGVFRRAFGDFRCFWIDPENPDRMIAGSDGGVFISYDGGRTCEHRANIFGGEMYALTVDMENPYHIYAGLQDHESWKGPSNGWSGQVGIEDWVTVGIGDGMYNQVDPTDSRWVYNTQEFGSHARFDQVTRTRTTVTPPQPQDQDRLRYNWVAPFRISPHDPKVLYAGAQFLFRTKDRGDTWERISPDLTTNDPQKISPPGAAIQFCTITTIDESPAKEGVIWVGADDGKVQVTQNGGQTWTDCTAKIAAAQGGGGGAGGGPEDAWVTRVFASPTNAGTAYVTKNRFRRDDFRPFVLKTTDFGATWTNISGNLPQKSLHVVVEDAKNQNLIFVGSDIGVFYSLNGGGNWSPLKANMPPVTVTDLVIHPREGDLVAGTYGRGAWITNVTVLREMDKAMASDVHFFTIQPRAARRDGALGNYRLYGDQTPTTPNDSDVTPFVYYLKEVVPGQVTITIGNAANPALRTLQGTNRAGLNRVIYPGGGRGGAAGRGGRGAGAGGAGPLEPGEYTVTLNAGGKTFSQKVTFPAMVILSPGESADDGDDDSDG